jgi:hypothetical protein
VISKLRSAKLGFIVLIFLSKVPLLAQTSNQKGGVRIFGKQIY